MEVNELDRIISMGLIQLNLGENLGVDETYLRSLSDLGLTVQEAHGVIWALDKEGVKVLTRVAKSKLLPCPSVIYEPALAKCREHIAAFIGGMQSNNVPKDVDGDTINIKPIEQKPEVVEEDEEVKDFEDNHGQNDEPVVIKDTDDETTDISKTGYIQDEKCSDQEKLQYSVIVLGAVTSEKQVRAMVASENVYASLSHLSELLAGLSVDMIYSTFSNKVCDVVNDFLIEVGDAKQITIDGEGLKASFKIKEMLAE